MRIFKDRKLRNLWLANNFGGSLVSILWSWLAGNNASNAQPLTALTGTAATQTATSAIVVADNLGVLNTVAAGYPVAGTGGEHWMKS